MIIISKENLKKEIKNWFESDDGDFSDMVEFNEDDYEREFDIMITKFIDRLADPYGEISKLKQENNALIKEIFTLQNKFHEIKLIKDLDFNMNDLINLNKEEVENKYD